MIDTQKPAERTSGKEALIAVGLGIVFMAVALFVQAIVQEIPEYVYLGLHGFSISLLVSGYSTFEFQHPLEFGLYLGLVAATMHRMRLRVSSCLSPQFPRPVYTHYRGVIGISP